MKTAPRDRLDDDDGASPGAYHHFAQAPLRRRRTTPHTSQLCARVHFALFFLSQRVPPAAPGRSGGGWPQTHTTTHRTATQCSTKQTHARPAGTFFAVAAPCPSLSLSLSLSSSLAPLSLSLSSLARSLFLSLHSHLLTLLKKARRAPSLKGRCVCVRVGGAVRRSDSPASPPFPNAPPCFCTYYAANATSPPLLSPRRT